MKNLLIVILLFLFSGVGVMAQQEKYSSVKIYTGPDGLKKLGSLGIPVEGKIKKGEYLICDFSASQIEKIKNAGFKTEILIDDIKDYYLQRNKKAKVSLPGPETDPYPTPEHFRLGSMGGFLTLAELMAELDSMRLYYPNLISTRQVIGDFTTTGGRNLYWVRISDNPDTDEDETEVQYSSLTHAREPMGMQQLVYFMWYLLENYETDSEIKYFLDNAELYFIPCVNPDGYEYNHSTDPNGGGMWRKNRRNNGGGEYGVDLNRNYGYQWGFDDDGSSPYPFDETYRGTSAFSEPETQATSWFAKHHNLRLLLDYHCFSDVLLYPWGYIDELCPDTDLYLTYSAYLTKVNNFQYGTCMQLLNYNANGGSFDWFYGEQTTKNKIIAWGPEAGNQVDGFWPESNRILPISKLYMDQNLSLTRLALSFAKITDKTALTFPDKNGYFKFDIQRLGYQDSTTFTVSLTGISNSILNCGENRVFSNLELFQTYTDSISYILNPEVKVGDTLKFILTINNQFISNIDTLVKIYGAPEVIVFDQCNNLTNWNNQGWGITSSEYVSGPSSITDSPLGNYSSNENALITLKNPVDLTNCMMADVSFYAKWDLEAGYDYTQLQVAVNLSSNWIPLQGKYTTLGSSDQDEDKPLYQGTQATWVKETINLGAYIGNTLKFRFRLISDGYVEKDGFYFDDFTIEKLVPGTEFIRNTVKEADYTIYPNPATDEIYIHFSGKYVNPVNVSILDITGRKMQEAILYGETDKVILNGYSPGVYLVKVKGQNNTTKLIVK